MNCLRHLSQRPFLLRPSPLYASLRRRVSSTPAPRALAPGAPVPGLEGVYPPGKDDASRAPLVLPREEYPAWVAGLVRPLPSLAKLRNMKFEDATDRERRRYLKLVRRAKIKANNEARAK